MSGSRLVSKDASRWGRKISGNEVKGAGGRYAAVKSARIRGWTAVEEANEGARRNEKERPRTKD